MLLVRTLPGKAPRHLGLCRSTADITSSAILQYRTPAFVKFPGFLKRSVFIWAFLVPTPPYFALKQATPLFLVQLTLPSLHQPPQMLGLSSANFCFL